MSIPLVDPAATRAAYERQYALLVPVVDGLREAAIATSPLVSDEWRGPAAEAARTFVHDLRGGLTEAADAVEDEVRRIRDLIVASS